MGINAFLIIKIAGCVVELAQGRAKPPVSVRYFALFSGPCRYRHWAKIRTRKLIPSRTTDVWNPNRALTFYAFECEQSDRRAVWRLFSASQPSGTKAWGRQLTQACSTYVTLKSDDTSAAENFSLLYRGEAMISRCSTTRHFSKEVDIITSWGSTCIPILENRGPRCSRVGRILIT